MEKVNLFISYSHVDKDYLPELFKYVNEANCPQIQIWTDQQIALGQVWNDQIKNSLDTADIVLLLVSQDFLNSVYIVDNELTEAFKRHEEKKATVIPIFLRYCLLDNFKQITNLQGYPDMRTPIAEAGVMKDRFYITIVQKLNETANAIIREKNIAKSQAANTGDANSSRAMQISELRNSLKIFVSIPSSPAGATLRTNFLSNAAAKIKNDLWPYMITPTAEEAAAAAGNLQGVSLNTFIPGCIYYILIAGSAADLKSDLFMLQYNAAKQAAAMSTFNRMILWFTDPSSQDGLEALEEPLKTALQQIPAIVGPGYESVFDMITQMDKGKEKTLTELAKTFSPVKKVFMFYDFEKDNDSDLRIQLRKKLQEDKQFVISDPADEGFEEQKLAVADCDAAIIYYGADSDSGWYKARERIILKAGNIKIGGRVAFVDGAAEPDIERKIDRDVSINEVITIKGQKELDSRVTEFKNSLK